MSELDGQISYCVNQYCDHRENVGDNLTNCKSCGGKLLLNDRYRLVKRLDKEILEGYTAKWVFEAEDTQNENSRVVLKIVDCTRLDWIRYLKREHDFLQIAPDPFYRVKKEDYFIDSPSITDSHFRIYCLVVPKIDGVDTQTWVEENGPIDELRCMEWLFELLPALEAFGEFSAIYRDLTPSNIMVVTEGHYQSIHLIDFGSVKIIDKKYLTILDSNLPNKDGSDIMRGTRIFTPAYAPREQLFGQSVPQTDFFALGRTIQYWMTGASPIDLWKDGGIDLAKHRPDLSKTFIDFVDWLTAEEPGARPPNAKILRSYLEQTYVYLVEAEDENAYFDNKVRDFRRKFYKKSVLIGAAVIGVLGVLGWFGVSQFWYRQGLKSLDSGDYQGASEELTQAYNLNPFLRDALAQKGFACIGFEDYECAEEVYQRLLKKDPNDSTVLYQLGFVTESMGQIEKAKEYYQQSLKAEPIQIDPHIRLARIAIEAEDYGEANENLRQVENKFKDFPQKTTLIDKALLNYYQGWLQLKQSDYKAAQNHLKTALKLLPTNSNISISPGDIFCLLAQARTELEEPSDSLIGSWSGCFGTVTKTKEGIAIRDQKMRSVLKNSLE